MTVSLTYSTVPLTRGNISFDIFHINLNSIEKGGGGQYPHLPAALGLSYLIFFTHVKNGCQEVLIKHFNKINHQTEH